MSDRRPVVVTVHGVNPDPSWQAMVGRVLGPHFRCIHLSYDKYSTLLGPVQVLFSLSLLMIAVAGAAVLVCFDHGWLAILVALVAIVTSPVAAWLTRRRCVAEFKRQLSAAVGHVPVPHLIAHSFGTYLTGNALRKFPDLSFQKIIFIGSVLPSTFDWKTIQTERNAFVEIRNEKGLRDQVVPLLRWVRWIARDLGAAGIGGFQGDPTYVHDEQSAWGPCPTCVSGSAPIHNVALEDFLHSDTLLGPGHARRLWLPYFWGYAPREFDEFVRLCWKAAYLKQEELLNELAPVEAELRARAWTWTSGTIEAYISRYLDKLANKSAKRAKAIAAHRDKIIDETIGFSYVAVTDAALESQKDDDVSPQVASALHPLIAITRAAIDATDLYS
jgi:pimeloyl-ACP methyl ester carboxylesterase